MNRLEQLVICEMNKRQECLENVDYGLGRFISEFAAAAAAKSLQSCPTLCNPIDGSPPGSPVPGIFQARVLEWVAIAFSAPNLQMILL